MYTMLLATLAASLQLPVTAPKQMLRAALDTLVPVHGTIHGVRVADRPLLVDVEATASAFRPLAATTPAQFADLGRPFTARRSGDAVACETTLPTGGSGDPERACAIDNDGILVRVDSAARASTPGEFRLVVSVLWTDTIVYGAARTSRPRIIGFRMEVFLAQVDGEWHVVRKGRTLVA